MTKTVTDGGPPHEALALCGGCRASGQCRLGLTSWHLSAEGVRVSATCPESWVAGPAIAHGGWTAAVFDDVVGRSVVARGERPVTAHLGVDYLLPVPVEHALSVRAHVARAEGRRRHVEAVLELASTGEVLARAEATMVVVDESHYERHRDRMAQRAAEPGVRAEPPLPIEGSPR